MSKREEAPPGEYVSASQIEAWRACKRKWAWPRLDKIKGAPKVAAEKGIVIHEILEAWLKDAKPIDIDLIHTLSDGTKFKPGPIAAAGLKHLPAPKTCGTERYIEVQTEVARYIGYIDFDEPDKEVPVVGDHKSTVDFKWAKTAEDLKKDPAANIYAAWLMTATKKDAVELRWVYYRTRGAPGAHKVSLVLLKDEVEAVFDDLDVSAAEILEARRSKKSALELEANPKSCSAYDGCRYIPNCNLSTKDKIKALMSQESLADKMKIKFQNGIAYTEPERQQEKNMTSLAEKMRAHKAAQVPVSAQTQAPAPAPAPTPAPAPAPTPAPTQAVEAPAVGGVKLSLAEQMKSRKQKAATVPTGINPPEGSTTREEIAAPVEEAAQVELTEAAVPKALRKKAGGAQAVPGGMPVFTMYVDCVPSKIKGVAICINTRSQEGMNALITLQDAATEVIRVLAVEG